MIANYTEELPWLTAEQMIEVDRAMIEDYRIDLIQMMENAGRALATVARECFLDSNLAGRRISVLAGTGGNGGGALVAARRLHNWGAKVRVFLSKPADRLAPVTAHHLETLIRMNVPVEQAAGVTDSDAPDLILDGILGYRLSGAPREEAARLIRWTRSQSTPVLALDIPSGIDATNGNVFDPAVRASATVTLALPKEGLRAPEAKKHVGDLYLADIGVPPEIYSSAQLGLTVGSIFLDGDIVRLR